MAPRQIKRSKLLYALIILLIIILITGGISVALLFKKNHELAVEVETIARERDSLKKDNQLYSTASKGFVEVVGNLAVFCQDTYKMIQFTSSAAEQSCLNIGKRNISEDVDKAMREVTFQSVYKSENE